MTDSSQATSSSLVGCAIGRYRKKASSDAQRQVASRSSVVTSRSRTRLPRERQGRLPETDHPPGSLAQELESALDEIGVVHRGSVICIDSFHSGSG